MRIQLPVGVPVQTVRTENSVSGALHLKVSPNDDTAVKEFRFRE
jgi:phosphoribosylcarboxyaminoimidazole (NCAIR) mutase